MSEHGTPKVTFLIIGAQKAGTTALHSMLRASADLCFPERKELHFFDDEEMTDWKNPDYGRYEAQFRDCAPGQICGEATPIYMFHEPCIERIRAYNPSMKLIAILRDPVARAYSQWRMETTRQLERESFSYSIRAGRARLASNFRICSYVERGFYAKQIRRMLDHFPRNQCHFLLSEDLLAHPADAIAELSTFLGCTLSHSLLPQENIDYFRSKPSLAPPSPEDFAYLRDLFRSDIIETGRLIERDLSDWA